MLFTFFLFEKSVAVPNLSSKLPRFVISNIWSIRCSGLCRFSMRFDETMDIWIHILDGLYGNRIYCVHFCIVGMIQEIPLFLFSFWLHCDVLHVHSLTSISIRPYTSNCVFCPLHVNRRMVLNIQFCHPEQSSPLGWLSTVSVYIVENAYDKQKRHRRI